MECVGKTANDRIHSEKILRGGAKKNLSEGIFCFLHIFQQVKFGTNILMVVYVKETMLKVIVT